MRFYGAHSKKGGANEKADRFTAESAVVNLRIEGANGTIFEGEITTAGHDVTTPTAGTHHADGTSKKNKKPYPTPISALDDAAHLRGFTFDGKYQAQWDSIFITEIGDTAQDSARFWGILLNYQFTPVGGCHQRIASGDQVLFAFDAFNKKYFLKLIGPTTTTVGVPITVTVIDGTTNTPAPGARVEGRQTDSRGQATLIFTSPGIRDLKAERDADSIRSNSLRVNVLR